MKVTEETLQVVKGKIFKQLHERDGLFAVPNPWDAGSAKLLASLGFDALATTSAGLAFSLGKADGVQSVTREETIKNAGDIAHSTMLPVTADLENGFGEDPESCEETILLAGQAGLAGGSIEDSTGMLSSPIIPFDLAVERIKAAVKSARSLPFHFTLTARAENFIHGIPDLKDTIRRLVAYAEAGADVLYAPGLKTRDEITAVVKAVAPKPVNVVMGLNDASFSISVLEDLGVKRVSLGSTLSRVAYSSFLKAAEEIMHKGTFTFANDIVSYKRFQEIMS